MISPISRQTNFTTFEHNNVNRCRHVNFRNRILKLKIYHKGSFFQKNALVKCAIPHRRRSEVCCLRLPCSVRRYKHGNQYNSLVQLLEYVAVLCR